MATFDLRVFPQIMQDMLATVAANTPLSDANYGSVLTTMLEAAATEDDEQYFQMLKIINNFSLDKTEGDDLVRRSKEYGLDGRREAAKANSKVTLIDTAITKVSTGVYSGLAGVSAGSTYINGDTATGFPVSGTIIIGRGKTNVEAIGYLSITTYANYVVFNLASGLLYDHGTDEEIILSQGGDRLFPAGTIVYVPSSDVSSKIEYEIDADATILDGESEKTEVNVTAITDGAQANVPVGAISEVTGAPVATASVNNPDRVTNGLDEETDQELRDRIKNHIQSLSRGTPSAIINGIIGLVSTSDNKRVVSSSIVEPTSPADVVKVYIDDGTGFVSTFSGIGYEEVVVYATGGEKFLTLDFTPLVKAFVETAYDEPFVLNGGEELFIEVGGETETIRFDSTDFETPGAATSEEVVTKINSVSLLVESRQSSEKLKVRMFARGNTNEQIRIVGGTANTPLGFPTDLRYTLKLYKNDQLLSKDGVTASLESGNAEGYPFGAGFKNLTIIVDGRDELPQQIWFDGDTDFANNGAVTAEEIVTVTNRHLQGANASVSSLDTKVTLTSNTKDSGNSKLRIIENFSAALNEEAGTLVDRIAEFKTGSTNVMMFGNVSDYVYVGHDDVRFDSVWFKLNSNASQDILLVAEYWNGATWHTIGVLDTTHGMTTSGFLLFHSPLDWAKITVAPDTEQRYWLRIQRTEAAALTPPVENMVKIGAANTLLGFTETEVSGANNDYMVNRFLGQIELNDALSLGDVITVGSKNTRAQVVTTSVQNFNLSGGETLTVLVDGVLQTATFQVGDFAMPGSATASEVITRLNTDLIGVTAYLALGGKAGLRINNYSGAVQVTGGTANAVLDFPITQATSLVSHYASVVSASAPPYTFVVNDSIIMVVDDNFANNLTIPCYWTGQVTSGTSGSVFVDTRLNPVFSTDNLIKDFYIQFTVGSLAGERQQISAYDAATGTVTVVAPFSGTPAYNDEYQIMPYSLFNMLTFWNNTKVTLLSNNATIEAVGGNKIQITSKTIGALGSIQVTGGSGNSKTNFSTLKAIGVDGYKFYTGLLQEVQHTIDGVEGEEDAYPGVRAAGVQVETIEPVAKRVIVELDVTTTEGVTLSGITSEIRTAVSNYINNLGVSKDVIRSEIIYTVKGVSGVFDVQVLNPTINIAINDYELPRVAETDITVG